MNPRADIAALRALRAMVADEVVGCLISGSDVALRSLAARLGVSVAGLQQKLAQAAIDRMSWRECVRMLAALDRQIVFGTRSLLSGERAT